VDETLPDDRGEHPVDRALRLVASAGAPPQSRRLVFALTADERRWAADYLDALGMSACRPLIGLQVASFATKSYRDWPIESFAALGRRVLHDHHGAGFLIFGGAVERERTERLASELGVRARSLAGQLSLRQTGALMSQLQAYVGVDTGPTHLMSSFDIPMVGLYHCRYPHGLWGPLEHPLDFSLDHPRRGSSAEADMAEMTVDSVYERLQAALGAVPA
jgi:heptosyltransferase-3